MSDDGVSDRTIVEWLLDSDPALRWQVQRDLTGEPRGGLAGDP